MALSSIGTVFAQDVPALEAAKIGDSNIKFHGVNLAAQMHFQVGYWPLFWLDVIDKPLYFDRSVKPYIIQAKELGFNTIRCITSVGGIVSGLYTRSELHAAYAQVIDYCREQGLYFYATTHGWGSPALTLTQVNTDLVTEITEMHKMLATKSNVIGVDHCNEINNFFGQVTAGQAVTFAQNVSTAINALSLSLPWGFSLTTTAMGITNSYDIGDSDADTISALGTICIRHQYTDPAYSDMYALAKYDKPVFVGEYGAATDNLTTRAARLDNAMLHLANDLCAGGCFFSLSKYSPNEPYEIIQEGGVVDSTLIDRMRRFVKANLNRYLDFDVIGLFKAANGTAVSSFTFQKGTLLAQSGSPAIQSNALRLATGNHVEFTSVRDAVAMLVVNAMNATNGKLRVSFYNGTSEVNAVALELVGTTLFWALINSAGSNVATGSFAVTFPFRFLYYHAADVIHFLPYSDTIAGAKANANSPTIDRIRVASATGNTDITLFTLQSKAF